MIEINDEQFAAVQALPGPERYAYFIHRVAECEELWTLRSEEDFVMHSDDEGREVLPVWPDRRFAEVCAAAGWEETKAFKIDLDRWLAAWTLGLETEGRRVAVFPLHDDPGVIVTPEQLAADLSGAST